jgi:purine-binding chemotaxis protein CheW
MGRTQSPEPAPAAAPADPGRQFLTFTVGAEVFALDILCIKEIIEFPGLTEVPMMPACVRGVINLRGAVVPVTDLGARFGRQPAAVTRRTCIVIVETTVEGERQDVGMMVDAVDAVLEIAGADIEPPPAFGAGIRTDFIAGMGRLNGRFIVLLDVDRVLSLQAPPHAGAPEQAA